MSKILINLDDGLLARIERERMVAERLTATETKPGKRPARTAMIRTLMVEAMDTRCQTRGEDVPQAPVLVEEEEIIAPEQEQETATETTAE